jgi:hypothetical protein
MVLVIVIAACKHDVQKPEAAGNIGPAEPQLTFRPESSFATLPVVPHASEELSPNALVIETSLSSIYMGNHKIMVLHDGAVDPSQLDGAASGISIPKLRRAFEAIMPKPAEVVLEVDQAASMQLLAEVAYSLEPSPTAHPIHVAVTDGKEQRVVTLIDHGHAPGAASLTIPAAPVSTPPGRPVIVPIGHSVGETLAAIDSVLARDPHAALLLEWNEVLQPQGDASAYAQIITADGSGEEGDMSKRRSGADLGQQILGSGAAQPASRRKR